MRCLLAVDSGGTKCEVILANGAGEVLGKGLRDLSHRPGERDERGLGRSEKLVTEALQEALIGAPPIDELHVAGRLLAPALWPFPHTPVIHYHAVREQDAPMALVGATAGVVVLAGTGAFVFGRSDDGRELLLDGIGPLYGDHGGAYQIGLAAVRAAGRSEWHDRYRTSLHQVILEACRTLAGNPTPFDMVGYMLESRDRSEIASLAKFVDREAEQGDAIAQSILIHAADDIVETVRCVVDRLAIADESLPLIGTGSVAVQSQIYWNRVSEQVQRFAPSFVAVQAKHPPALGMLLSMAVELGIDTDAFRRQLLTGTV